MLKSGVFKCSAPSASGLKLLQQNSNDQNDLNLENGTPEKQDFMFFERRRASRILTLTGVDAGAGRRDPKLRLDELWDESDESGDDGALCRVGQADEEEGHIAQDPHCSFW